jgi:ankyrin repeat protein
MPLHIAAYKGQLAVVQCLVELGADFKITNGKGHTPLMQAASHLDVMRYVVEELGADVDQKKKRNGPTALMIAVHKGDLAAIQCLVKLGADINQTSPDGLTPLTVASSCKYVEIVKWLVKEGADPRVKARWGTASEILIDHGATAEETAYLQAKTHCTNTGCSGVGLMKCMGCN